MAEAGIVSFRNVSKRRGAFCLDISLLDIAEGEFFSIIGQSGSGKTTLLHLIGGFTAPDTGAVVVDGQPLGAQRGHKRVIRTLFQDLALFPHLTVYEQMELALRAGGTPKGQWYGRIMACLNRLELARYCDRRPSELSGGERQRLALGRAIVSEPRVVLLDEPMGALDPGLRQDLWERVVDLRRSISSTFIVVTHDPNVALGCSTRLAIIENGSCVQTGTPAEIYARPGSEWISRFVESANVVHADGRKYLIRPEDVQLGATPQPPEVGPSDEVKVLRVGQLGSRLEFVLSWRGQLLTARQPESVAGRFVGLAQFYAGWDCRQARDLSN